MDMSQEAKHINQTLHGFFKKEPVILKPMSEGDSLKNEVVVYEAEDENHLLQVMYEESMNEMNIVMKNNQEKHILELLAPRPSIAKTFESENIKTLRIGFKDDSAAEIRLEPNISVYYYVER